MTQEQTGQSNLKFSDINLGIVCPMANEKATAVDFVRAVLANCVGFRSVQFFVIFDKACKDGSVDVLRDMPEKPAEVKVVWSPENTCVVDAYIRGYNEAIKAGCDWVLEIDAGFSHEPKEIPLFLEKMAEGYDCVFGSRFAAGGQFTDAPWRRKFISKGGTCLANLLLGTRLADMTSGFEMFTNAALKEVLDKGIRSKGHFFQTEIKTFCRRMNICEVPIHYKSPSENVNTGVLIDSFRNLFGLFWRRLTGKL